MLRGQDSDDGIIFGQLQWYLGKRNVKMRERERERDDYLAFKQQKKC